MRFAISRRIALLISACALAHAGPSLAAPLPDWVSIGPKPIIGGQTPQDFSLASNVSGRVTAIEIDPVDGSVYVGTAQGGVWKTQNGGATWTPITDSLDSLAIGSIAIDRVAHAAGHATLYVGTGEGNGSLDSFAGVGVYKSTDSGQTWSGPLGATVFRGRAIAAVAVDRANSNVLLAATTSGLAGVGPVAPPNPPVRGIYRSADGGTSWTCVTCGVGGTDSDRFSNLVQDPLDANTWYAAGWYVGTGSGALNGGLLKSFDEGVTWTQLAGTGGLPVRDSSWDRAWVTAAASPTATKSTVYVGTGHINTGTTGGRVYKTTDGGVSWVRLSAADNYCDGQCFYDMPLLAEPGDPSILYHGGASAVSTTSGTTKSCFRRSDDGGTTFVDRFRSAATGTALHSDVHVITSWPGQPNEIWNGNDGGVWRSTDRGNTWTNVNAGLSTTLFQAGDVHPSDPTIAYGGTQSTGTIGWTGSASWPTLDFGSGGFSLIDQQSPNRLVHTYFNQSSSFIGVGYTTAGFAATQGSYLSSMAPGNGISLIDRVLFYAPIHFDRGVSDTLYFGTNRLYRASSFFSNPNGFVLVRNQDLAASTDAISAIETVASASAGQNAQTIFTGSSNGHVFRTLDAGATAFTEVDVGGSPLYVSDIAVDPANPATVYASRSGFSGSSGQNVRKSTNGGATWSPAAAGIPDVPVNALLIDPAVANRVWAGTDQGVYVSLDGGANWAPHLSGMPKVPVFDLKGNVATNAIIAFTHGRGAYRLSPIVPPVCTDPYQPLPPVRILDTRNGTGAPLASVGAGGTIAVQVVGVGGVPATAVSAVVLNVTAANATGNGNLRVYPSDLSTPPLVSNVNFRAGENTPNLAIAKTGSDGDIKIHNGSGAATVDVVGDVQGYFVDPSLSYGPLSPVRILDTRDGTGGIDGAIGPGQTITLTVLGAGGVPSSGVSAVALNVTAAGGTGNGNLSVYPSDESNPPAVSNLNFQASTNRANLVIVKVGSDGAVKIHNGSGAAAVHAVADTQGFFSTATTCYGPLSPLRVLDTRSGLGGTLGPIAPGATFSLQVLGVAGVPSTGVGAVALNVTAANGTGNGNLRVFPSDESSPPLVSNLNFRAGVNVPNLVIVKVGADGAVKIHNGSANASVDVVADVQGSFAE